MAELPDPFRFGRCELRSAQRQLLVDGVAAAVGGRAFDLLVALAARRDRVVSKNELFDVVWPGLIVEENNLQVQISALRKLLGATAIATVPQRGYRFTAAEAEAGSSIGSGSPAPAAASAVAVPAVARPATDAARLLVADDNKVNRLLLARSLQLLGHDVASVDNGRQALQRLQDEPFDLVLLDLEMPEMDGFALLEQLAADPALREVPVIVTSSLEGVVHVARCIQLGAEDYLRKPVNQVLLEARVRSSLEKKRLRDQQRALLRRLGATASGLWVDGASTRQRHATVLAICVQETAPGIGTDAADALALLHDWSTLATEAVAGAGGRLLQMQGDGAVAVFEAAGAGGERAAAQAAARAEREWRAMLAQLDADGRAAGRAPLAASAGLASGVLTIGSLATAAGPQPVAIGRPLHAASRLATHAAGTGSAALADAATAALLDTAVAADAATDAVRLTGANEGDGPVFRLR